MANFNFNKVMLGGRLTNDPELKQSQSGTPVAAFRMAVGRRVMSKTSPEQQQTDFFNVKCFFKTAEFVSRYFRKGSSIFVVGSVQISNYTDQQGNKQYFTEILAEEIQFVDSKSENPSFGAPASGNNAQPYVPDNYGTPSYSSQGASETHNFSTLSDDDDLPF